MSIRRSIAAAVFVAAVSAPTVLGTAQAMAETAPTTPTGQSAPDAVPAEQPAAPAAPAEQPAAPESPAAPEAPAAPVLDEAALRARLAAALAESGHYAHYYETVKKAQAGTAEQIQHFLDVELIVVIHDDNNIRATQIMSESGDGPIRKAAQEAFNDGSPEAIEHFLNVTVPALTADNNRVKLSQFAEDPLISAGLRTLALSVLDGGDDEAIAGFLGETHWRLMDDFRIQATQAMSVNGPEVRKVVNQLLTDGTLEELRAFLTTGLKEAQERDRAAAQENGTGGGTDGGKDGGTDAGTGAGTGGNAGTGPDGGDATQAGLTTATTTTSGTTTSTTTATGTETDTQLAFTGPGTPLAGVTATGAAAIALGAGALVVTRRRRQES
ncbi:ALF repeat-containing protein [Kitasatospora sp. NPDC004272]